ncbi:formate hydrogenlyase regulatory protein HycA [Catenuloplanes nepalensis]|uniref:Formate hydrogenlyase regulatory protein HycA n=1 Tax=Catenuloplanes nepalensis TaxID=587533 RepID=A0ABT9MQ08_9ACTN|nr:hypothetical protein [Catenuloplanes nepalensis]MDP9793483.1 formate hydrogenlyase regulatory protein HycA [Catenuloplanes nepalensis]
MPVPRRIPIAWEADHQTHTIGRYAEGQFYAAVHGTYRPGAGPAWYAYVHLFDADGLHRETRVRLLARTGVLADRAGADRVLAGLLAGLRRVRFGDIAVQPFRFEHDGVVFALVDESDEHGVPWAELYPDRLGFTEPWNG